MSFLPGQTWSHSASKMKKECLRLYFYHVYGSWGGWSKDASAATQMIYLAKQSHNLASYSGTFMHDAIRRMLQWVRIGRVIAKEKVLPRIEQKMREEIAYSKEGKWKGTAPNRATLILLNHVTGEDLHEEEIEEYIEKSKTGMKNFMEEIMPGLEASETKTWLTIDSLNSVKMEDFQAYMVPDFVHIESVGTVWQGVTISPDTMVITDWKTGFSTDTEQLAIYALYMQEQSDPTLRAPDPNKILGRSVPLLDLSRTAWRTISPDEIAQKRLEVLEDISEMRALVEPGRAKLKDMFPRTEHRGRCKNCRYSFFCWRDD